MLNQILLIGIISTLLLVGSSESIPELEPDPTKYHYIKYTIVYDRTEIKAETDFSVLNSERVKYQLRESKQTGMIETNNYKVFTNQMFFENPLDAEAFMLKLKSQVQERDVVYALIWHTENTHHYIHPQPDIVIERIEFGVSPERFD